MGRDPVRSPLLIHFILMYNSIHKDGIFFLEGPMGLFPGYIRGVPSWRVEACHLYWKSRQGRSTTLWRARIYRAGDPEPPRAESV